METINIEDQCLLYLFSNKIEKVYVGETSKGYARFYQHKDKKFDKHNVKYISGKKLNFLNNEYFRKYYELRLINKFKPRYNKETTTAPTLNEFICKMFLWNENPNSTFVHPLTSYNAISYKGKFNKYLEYKNKKGKFTKILNQYTNIWDGIDINKKLYINGKNAFKFLTNETIKPTNDYSIKFTPRLEKLHN